MPSKTHIASLALLLTACGGDRPSTPPPEGVGISDPTAGAEVEVAEDAIELSLRRSDGTFLEVGELRGHVVLLYVFATFDGVSQMLLNPLREVADRHPEVRIVGIAAQPSARLLVDAYEHALSPPFPVTYDPEETVVAGQSALGDLGVVPVLITLDARGREVERHTGFVRAPRIEEMLRAAAR